MSTDPLRRFEAEHDVALEALARLERAALALRSGRAPSDSHFPVVREVLTLLSGPVREHNEAEERALFPFLGAAAPLGPFLEEHQTLWGLEQSLGRAIERGDPSGVADLSLEIVSLLRAHIERENEVLFPMARALLGADRLAAVARVLDSRPA